MYHDHVLHLSNANQIHHLPDSVAMLGTMRLGANLDGPAGPFPETGVKTSIAAEYPASKGIPLTARRGERHTS
jgi:hypothetical protein